jgi:hypothetical protein
MFQLSVHIEDDISAIPDDPLEVGGCSANSFFKTKMVQKGATTLSQIKVIVVWLSRVLDHMRGSSGLASPLSKVCSLGSSYFSRRGQCQD